MIRWLMAMWCRWRGHAPCLVDNWVSSTNSKGVTFRFLKGFRCECARCGTPMPVASMIIEEAPDGR